MVSNSIDILQANEEQMSENSEATSIRSENPARIEDIFEWIEGIPLSKTTKNLARDFSDAVLMAEILKFYYPQLVTSHNYIPANNIQCKKENWNTLNRKVLTKIDLRLTPETIDQLAHSQTGVIEKVLVDFRDKQMALKIDDGGNSDYDVERMLEGLKPNADDDKEVKKTIFKRIYGGIKGFFGTIFTIFLAIVCFWRWFSWLSRKLTKEPTKSSITAVEEQQSHQQQQQQQEENEAAEIHDLYSQALEELRVKSDVIKTLCHKVAFLEGTMKLKDTKISSLTSQIDQLQNQLQHPMEVSQIPIKQNSTLNSPNKIRKRPRTQM